MPPTYPSPHTPSACVPLPHALHMGIFRNAAIAGCCLNATHPADVMFIVPPSCFSPAPSNVSIGGGWNLL